MKLLRVPVRKRLVHIVMTLMVAVVACPSCSQFGSSSRTPATTKESYAPIVIDGFGDGYYASMSCFGKDADICKTGAYLDAASFDKDLLTQFAALTTCKATTAMLWWGPKLSSPPVKAVMAQNAHWILSASTKEGRSKADWTLKYPSERDVYFQGQGDAEHIVRQVCSIVKGFGAQVTN